MKYNQFKKRLNYFSNKVTFTDINGEDHYLFQKESAMNDRYNIKDILNLHEKYTRDSYDWITKNKPELLTKNQ